jgi:heat shock protein HslJ
MNFFRIIAWCTIILLLQSCGNSKKITTVWVSGVETKCFTGAGDMPCLNIYRGEHLEQAKWEFIYSGIQGFNFEKGVYKKIVLEEQRLKEVPMDHPGVEYTLIKEIEQRPDKRFLLEGKWQLNEVAKELVIQDIEIPTLELDLYQMTLSGASGCNNYSTDLRKITEDQIFWDTIEKSTKTCTTKNIESTYRNALLKVKTYEVQSSSLFFYDERGEQLLSFLKTKNETKQRLQDIWITKAINGKEVLANEQVPVLEINLTRMDILLNNGCQEYMGSIESVSDTKFDPGMLVLLEEEDGCGSDMQKFLEQFKTVQYFNLKGLELTMLDKMGKEVLRFHKGD